LGAFNQQAVYGGLLGASTPAFGVSIAPALGLSQVGLGFNVFGNKCSPGLMFGETIPAPGLTESLVCNCS
jgi:hypothetical protein